MALYCSSQNLKKAKYLALEPDFLGSKMALPLTHQVTLGKSFTIICHRFLTGTTEVIKVMITTTPRYSA